MHRLLLPLLFMSFISASELTNLTLNRPASASGEQLGGGNIAASGNDGDPATRWCCNNGDLGNWWQVELDGPQHVRRIEIDWEHAYIPYQYRIDASADGTTWKTIVDATAAPGRMLADSRHDVDEPGMRLVKITVTGQPGGVWTGFWEVRVLGGDQVANASPQWEQLPMVSAAQLAKGIFPGGEGCQRLKALAIDPVTGSRLFLGTDVGGIFRSIDGGKRFAPANIGFTPRGAESFAADPRAPDRILASGTYPEVFGDYHGLFLSEDAGATWRQVFPERTKSYAGHQTIVWDPQSDAVFWTGPQGLVRSGDRGRTWAAIANSVDIARAHLAVLPDGSAILAANDKGLRRSLDHGATWQVLSNAAYTGLAVAAAAPTTFWACQAEALHISTDGGKTLTTISHQIEIGRYKGAHFSNLAIHPQQPLRMLMADTLHGFFYASHDGGQTWTRGSRDVSDSWFDPRIHHELNGDGQVVWHPTDPNRAWAVGVGDVLMASTDGGRSWHWANNGNAGLMLGSTFTFNATDPDRLYLGSQDYNGALTGDGGRSWEYVDLSRFRFGYVYGGYAAGPDLLFGGSGAHWGGPRRLLIQRGGNSPANVVDTGIALEGYPVCAGDPRDPKILFAYGHRSIDRAQTWQRMTGCDGVMTHHGDALYGRNNKQVVRSTDHGASWQVLGELPGDVSDLAYDAKRDCFLVVAQEQLWRLKAGQATNITAQIPADQLNNHRVITVATDPLDQDVHYVGSRKDLYSYEGNIVRSTDGGKSWQIITRTAKADSLVTSGPDGGREPMWIRVHPENRHLYVGTNCFGVWRFPPPK